MKGYGRVEGIVELFLFDSMTGSLVAVSFEFIWIAYFWN